MFELRIKNAIFIWMYMNEMIHISIHMFSTLKPGRNNIFLSLENETNVDEERSTSANICLRVTLLLLTEHDCRGA